MAAVTSAASAAAARIGAALSDAQYFESSMVRVEDIRRQLDSKSVKDKLDAMKRVVALISLGKDASTFFPDVVKNVVAPSLEVKKLVYLYLVHYAEEKQDLALLAINTFQKDLSDHNQHIRALSLRVLSSIRVKVILQVVILAVNKASMDSSPYVRKAAAHAISKVCALDSASKDTLMEPLHNLVSDRSTQVMGSAIAAFEEVCPFNYNLIHPHYRRICSSLADVDPWGQITIINMLLRYARVHFADPNTDSSAGSGKKLVVRADRVEGRNADLSLLLESVAPLFFSLNGSVVGSAIAVYFHLATKGEFANVAIRPLMRLVAVEDDGGQAVGLKLASKVAMQYPALLIPYVSEFYVSVSHSAPIRSLRMNVLTEICASAGEQGGIGSKPHVRRALLSELKDYLFRRDKDLAAASARAIGCLATAHPGSTPAIVKVLSSVVGTASNPAVVSESIAVLRRLLQRHPSAQARALPQLIAMLLADAGSENTSIQEPGARASIIWLLGEFYEKVDAVANEALRLLARGFVGEAAEVKLQILNLASKVVAWNSSSVSAEDSILETGEILQRDTSLKLLEYIVSCARYDRDYDVRDKARMLQSLFFTNSQPSLLKASCKAFTSRKPIPSSVDTKFSSSAAPGETTISDDVVIGSLTHVLAGRRLPGFQSLEPWAAVDSISSLRDEALGGGGGASFHREYKGVSSADYQGMVTTVDTSESVWENPQSISSSQVVNLNGAGLAVPGTGLGKPFGLQTQHAITSTIGHVDPERFYDSDRDDEESSEYDSSSEEETAQDYGERSSASVQPDRAGGPVNVDMLVNTVADPPKKDAPSTVRKPSSEYDLDALLGGLTSVGLNTDKEKIPSTIKTAVTDGSAWIRIVESWKAGGLEIDASYLRSAAGTSQEATPVLLRVTNRGHGNVNNIAFSSRSGDCFLCTKSIATLQPNESRDVETEAFFRGKTGSVRFSVDITGQSKTVAEFKPTVGYVIRPHASITPREFMTVEKSLCGMFGSDGSVQLSGPKHNDWMGLARTIKEKLLEICFFAHVKTAVGSQGVGSDERFSILFAGFLPSAQLASTEKRSVLVRVTVNSANDDSRCECQVWVGCEDVLFSANMMRLCKSTLQNIHSGL